MFMNLKSNTVFFQVVNIVAFAVTLVVNGLAGSTTVLGGVTSADISDMYPTLVTPAGFTFAIWGIIYTLLAVFVVYQLLTKNKQFLQQVGVFFALSSLLNVCWLFLWHYDFVTYSLILMFGLLASLILVYMRLDIGRVTVSLKERLCVHLPFSVYLGWISIATIANVSVALTAVGWNGFGIAAETWFVAVICVAVALTLALLVIRGDVAFSLVVVWALTGMLSKPSISEGILLTGEVAIATIILSTVSVVLASKLNTDTT